MINRVKENISQPEELENYYRTDKKSFEADFEEIYSEIEKTDFATFWKIRIDYDKPKQKTSVFIKTDVIVLILASIISGFLIKLPEIINIDLKMFFFYEKNAGIIVFFGLSIYLTWKTRPFNRKNVIISILAFLIPLIYINLLPSDRNSDSINLAYIHLPLLMWCIYGLIYINYDIKDKSKRIDFIKYNGDLAILGAIILIAGGALTGITIGLFSAIDVNIENFYTEYIVIWGLVSAPIVTSFIIWNYPTLTNKIAPVIANIFSPIVLLTLIIYLITIPVAGKDPYNDRDFLLIFNLMLLGVMGIIVFSVTETSINRKQKFNEMILFILVLITILIDLVALSAIFYRLGEYGITPNRLAVLGSNLLIFGNLVLILIDLFKVNFSKSNIEKVGFTISKYLVVYTIWTLIVVFGFPLIFGMK